MTRLREHHRVALAQRDAGMVVAGDARQRAARLALAAGDQHQQVVVGNVVDIVLAQERRQAGEVAALARRRLHVAQDAADQGDAAPGMPAPASATDSTRATLHGEAGHRHAAAQAADQRGQVLRAPRASQPEWPSTIALVESQTIASTPSSPSAVSAASSVGGPTSGVGSSFQSPVCSTTPDGVRDRQRLRFRDRVRHADEAQRERLQLDRAAGRDDVQLHLIQQLRLAPACGAAPRRRTAWRRPGSAVAATARRPRPDDPRAHG